MSNEDNAPLKYLFEFLSKSKILSHQVINPPLDLSEKSQFLSLDGTISKTFLETIIKCLLEKGLRDWLLLEEKSNFSEIEKRVISKRESMALSLESFFQNRLAVIRVGKEFYLPRLNIDYDSNRVFSQTPLIHSMKSLKTFIIEWMNEVWDKNKILIETEIRRKLSRKHTIKPFIDSGDPKILAHFFSFLMVKGYVNSNLQDLNDLFSGIPPQNKVEFKDANILNYVKKFLIEKKFRKSESYSLSKNFSPYVEFFDEKNECQIKKLLFNVSKNNNRYLRSFMEDDFQDYLNKVKR